MLRIMIECRSNDGGIHEDENNLNTVLVSYGSRIPHDPTPDPRKAIYPGPPHYPVPDQARILASE